MNRSLALDPPAAPPRPAVSLPGSPSWRYLARFACADLWHNFFATLPGALTLLLMVVLAIVGWGLLEGKREVLGRGLNSEIARCLEVDALQANDVVIDVRMLQSLRQVKLADGRPITDEPARNIHPWIRVQMLFWRAGSDGPAQLMDHRHLGRTAGPHDPLLGFLAAQEKRPRLEFSDDNALEIIVSRAFLKECGHAEDATRVWLDVRGGQLPLAVRGVVESIPDGYQYLLPDGFYQHLATPDFHPDPLVNHIALTHAPRELREWLRPVVVEAKDAKAPREDHPAGALADDQAELRAWLTERNLELAYVDDTLALRAARGRRFRASQMERIAKSLRERWEAAGKLQPGVLQTQLPPSPKVPAEQTSWTHAWIVTRGINELEEVARAVAPLGLVVDQRYIQLNRRLQETIGPLNTILLIVVGLAGAVALLNLGFTTFQRVQLKRFEIGVLKAAGMTFGHIMAVFAIEGLLLGAAVGCLGLLTGLLLGYGVAALIGAGLFHWVGWMFLVPPGVALFSAGVAPLRPGAPRKPTRPKPCGRNRRRTAVQTKSESATTRVIELHALFSHLLALRACSDGGAACLS